MRKALIVLLSWLGLLAGCNGEPTYQGVSLIAYNYTPWDVANISIADSAGNKAGTGAIRPGGGEGSVTCCYTLKGTTFTVKWRVADGDELRKHMYDGKFNEMFINKETTVNFPASSIPSGDGPLNLELHIYPDEHMEMVLSRKLLGQARIPIVETSRWLYRTYPDAFKEYEDASELNQRLVKVTKTAWTKYRIQDEGDLRQYMYLYFTVAANFDADPEIAEILSKPDRRPGDFAKAVSAFGEEKIARLRSAGTLPGAPHG